jgi:Predicted chitinase
MQLYEKYKTLFDKYEINTPIRIAHLMAQIEHESGLKPISENLNYSSVERLRLIFKTPFKGKDDVFVSQYVGNSTRLGSYVYANRNGNGNELSLEGWKYRGRGFIQITGKENYLNVSNSTGLDCVNNPDLLLEEPNALISALWFWKKNDLNSYADKPFLVNANGVKDYDYAINKITKIINGGYNGIEHRKELLLKWKQILK